jgi:hypothetical protein
MTMAHILDEGVTSLSFRLEGVEQVDTCEYIYELLSFQKGPLEQVDVREGTWKFFLECDRGMSPSTKKY